MRSVFLIAYDIVDDKRRTKIFHKLKGYGEALQYSLFRCVLSPNERLRLRTEIWELVNFGEDRVLVVDLGPDDGRGQAVLETWGRSLDDPAEHQGILVV